MAKKDKISGILLFLVFACAYVQALGFPKSSAYFPKVICLTGMLLCGILVVRSFISKTVNEAKTKQLDNGQMKKIGGMTVMIILYSVGMNTIGFVISTILFIAVSGVFLYPGKLGKDNRKPVFLILGSDLILTVVIWFVFKSLLYVPLPTGILFR